MNTVYNYLHNRTFFVLLCSGLSGLVLAMGINLALATAPLPLSPFVETALPYSAQVAEKAGLKSKNSPVQAVSQNVVLLSEFILRGTITGSLNAAIIDHKGKGEYVFLNSSYEGYVLKEVTKERVIFEKNGTRYTLFLYTEQGQASVAQNVTVTSAQAPLVIKSKEKFELIKQKDGNYFIPRALVREYLHLDTIFSQIGVVGMFHNDVLEGFMVRYVNMEGIFARLGLQQGDKIVKVNDKALTSMQEPFEYFNRLDALDKLKLSVIRNNEEKELLYEMY